MNTFTKHIIVASIAAFISTLLMVASFTYAGVTVKEDKIPQMPTIRGGYIEITPFFLLKNKSYEVVSSSTATMTTTDGSVTTRNYMLASSVDVYGLEIMAVTDATISVAGMRTPGHLLGVERHGNMKFKTSYFFDDSQGKPGRTCKVWTSVVDGSNRLVRVIYMEMGDQTANLKAFLKRADKNVEFKIR